MKTFLLLLTAFAFILAGAHFTSGRMPDPALALAGLVSAVIAAWTLAQYDRKFLPLSRGRVVRPSLPGVTPRATDDRSHRAAA